MSPTNPVAQVPRRRNCSGQALITVTLALPFIFGMTALVADYGVVYLGQEQLDASTQAAALAGAHAMSAVGATTTSVTYAVTLYGGVSGKNAYSNLTGVTVPSGYPMFKCLNTLKTLYGTQCYGPSSSNALVVKQQVTQPLFFLRVFGFNSVALTSVASAAMKGSAQAPYNVALVLDTTSSMNSNDNDVNCGHTRIYCALAGARLLLTGLSPCAATSGSCGTVTNGNVANSVDRVSLFTYPPVSTSTVANAYNCSGNSPTVVKYQTPLPATSTYQVVGLSSDYRASVPTTTLSASSHVVAALGGKSGCPGMTAAGGVGTYIAQAITTAQAYLVSQQSSYPNSQNVMIVVSDGDAGATSTNMPGASTSSGVYMSTLKQCHQAITAAQAAATAGTRVYSVAYGAVMSGCSSDSSPSISPCETMRQIASAASYFFSDYTASGGSTSCTSTAQPITGLNKIFQTIVSDLSVVKLIPNSTT